MANGINGQRIKRNRPFTPDYFFCVQYPAEHALKWKGVQGAERPGRGLGAEGPGGGGSPPDVRYS